VVSYGYKTVFGHAAQRQGRGKFMMMLTCPPSERVPFLTGVFGKSTDRVL